MSVDGLLALEARFYTVQHFADRFSTKWSRTCSEVMGLLQTRLSFAILRATNQCVRDQDWSGVVLVWMMGQALPWLWNYIKFVVHFSSFSIIYMCIFCFVLYDLKVMVAVVCNHTSPIFRHALLKVVQNLYCNAFFVYLLFCFFHDFCWPFQLVSTSNSLLFSPYSYYYAVVYGVIMNKIE